jgi:hypothetical protein
MIRLRWIDFISKWEPSNMTKTTFKKTKRINKTKKKRRKNSMKESWKTILISKIKCKKKKWN